MGPKIGKSSAKRPKKWSKTGGVVIGSKKKKIGGRLFTVCAEYNTMFTHSSK